MAKKIDRQTAGRKLVEAWRTFVGRGGIHIPDMGDTLLQYYLSIGRGEAEDVRSTIVDMVADIGRHVRAEGMPFGPVCESADAKDVAAGIPEADLTALDAAAAHVIADLKVLARDEGLDFDRILWVAQDHVGAEAGREGPAGPL